MGDVLRLKGFLVEPAEIESRLAEHEAVETAKVVGTRLPGGETVAIGFVTVRPTGPTPDGEELRHFIAKSLARFKVPTEVRIIRKMPTTAGTNGTKIRAATLREWAAEDAVVRS